MSRHQLGGVAALLAALFGLACGHTQAHAVAFEAPPGGREVLVLASAPPPGLGRPLGVVSASGDGRPLGNNAYGLYAELVRQTRALGGNALVLESMGAEVNDATTFSGPTKDVVATFSSPANGCGMSCLDRVGYTTAAEGMKVQLRGKALLLSPEERASLAPPAPDRSEAAASAKTSEREP